VSDVVPDGIVPEIGWRAWSVFDGLLHSINSHYPWPVKEAFEAECGQTPKQEWVARRYGRLVPTGRIPLEVAHEGAVLGGFNYGYETGDITTLRHPMPAVQLPKGYGYELEETPKDIPDADCTCGIYALKSRAAIVCSPYASNSDAVGAVSLWGKIVPGTDGFRARFSYPLLVYTDLELFDYGVPVRPLKDMGTDMPVRMLRGKR